MFERYLFAIYSSLNSHLDFTSRISYKVYKECMKKWNEENPGRAKEAMTQVCLFFFILLVTDFIDYPLNRSRFSGKMHQRTLIAARKARPANPRLLKNPKSQKQRSNPGQRRQRKSKMWITVIL
jgi:hypothetical protein